jgi:hypothetical protein
MIRTAAVRTLGDAQKRALIESGVSSGLTTAAMVDPEPFSKAALLVAAGLTHVFGQLFSGCGQSCIEATRIVDEIGPYLEQLKNEYVNATVRTPAMQKQALEIFDSTWAKLVELCSDPSLGDAGRRCISERQRGGSAPWCPTGTGCDYFTLYRDPIANTPPNAADPMTLETVAAKMTSGSGLLFLALALVVMTL